MVDGQPPAAERRAELERDIGTPLLALYGAGTILGAGIFVLIGKVVGIAGYWAPLAFLLAASVAALNGMVFAELSTRLPRAGGPSDYVSKAFHARWFTVLLGWMIVATGIVSGATITNGFSGYLVQFVAIPEWVARTGLLLLLGGVAAAGAKESAWFMATTTTLGGIGLAIVLYAGFFTQHAAPATALLDQLPPLSDSGVLVGLLSATFLSIYAYIGFEDMVHMAEEVRQPARAMPLAIAIALVVAAVLYVLVSIAALNVMSPQALEQAKAPLVAVVTAAGLPMAPIAFLSLAIILNGALAQIIMATRVIYSLGGRHGAPRQLTGINPRTRTPLRATVFATTVCLALALFIPLKTLASITSLIILLVFVASCLALIVLERRQPQAQFDTPRLLPWIALTLSGFLVIASFFVGGGGH